MRWVMQNRYTVKEAIAAAIKDQEVRTTYFVTQLACAKSRKRERSPHPEPKQPAPNQPRNNNQAKGKGGQGKGGKGKGKGGKQDWGQRPDHTGTAETREVNSVKRNEKLLVAVPGSGRMICIKFNRDTCAGAGCRYEHACMWCGEYGHRLGQCTKQKTPIK